RVCAKMRKTKTRARILRICFDCNLNVTTLRGEPFGLQAARGREKVAPSFIPSSETRGSFAAGVIASGGASPSPRSARVDSSQREEFYHQLQLHPFAAAGLHLFSQTALLNPCSVRCFWLRLSRYLPVARRIPNR